MSLRGMVFLFVLCCAAGTVLGDVATRTTPVVRAVAKARPSVVNISTDRTVLRRSRDPFDPGGDFFDDIFERFFRGRHYVRERVETPLGSGVILDADGFVVTNEHVVRRATRIRVSLAAPEEEIYDARLICADPKEDLALLKIEADRRFTPIRPGTSSDIMLGETVIALGNPFGFEDSVSSGIVSALGRDVRAGEGEDAREYKDLIQTSALINPGNSGGPLINIDAELIGINSAVVSGAQGIGFAIPVDRVLDVLARLFAHPRVCPVQFGADVTGDDAGVRVTGVTKGSPAATAGLRAGDRITRLGDHDVTREFDLRHGLVRLTPGGNVALVVERNGRERRLDLPLKERSRPSPEHRLDRAFGVAARNVTPTVARRLGLAVEEGVLVADIRPEGPAATAGLRAGDVIIQIGAYRVHNLQEAAEALDDLSPGREVYVKIVRRRFVAAARMTIR